MTVRDVTEGDDMIVEVTVTESLLVLSTTLSVGVAVVGVGVRSSECESLSPVAFTGIGQADSDRASDVTSSLGIDVADEESLSLHDVGCSSSLNGLTGHVAAICCPLAHCTRAIESSSTSRSSWADFSRPGCSPCHRILRRVSSA